MTFSTDLATLTPAEAHALETHLRYAGDESFAAHGATDTVRDLDQIARTVTSARKNILGTGRAPKAVTEYVDTYAVAHDSLFGALNPAERYAFAVHMVHAMEESAHAGYAALDMRSELTELAYDADHAAQNHHSKRRSRSLAVGSPA